MSTAAVTPISAVTDLPPGAPALHGLPTLQARPHIFPAKLAAPPVAPGAIVRERLLARLDAGIAAGAPLSVIVAPAGWGKTTLLSAWAARIAERGHGVAWVALDGRDADPNRFWWTVVAALERVSPGIGAGIMPLLNLPDPLPETAVAALLTATESVTSQATSGGPLILVLDDVHHVDHNHARLGLPGLVQQLGRAGASAGMHLVLAGRSEPPVPLGRLRASGALTELRAADLRFDEGETAAFLTGTMTLVLPPSQVAALATQTEGWAAGLRLAALSLKSGSSPLAGSLPGRDVRVTGSNRAVADYLLEEVFGCLPESDRAFLLRTSVPERLTGPLSDALMAGVNGGSGAGETGWETLERLERAGLFLMSLDADRRWYRYHRLFADYLRERLGREHGETVPELYRRAAAWYEQEAMLVEAIDLLMVAPDYPAAADLIARVAPTILWSCGEVATMRRWLDALPEAIVRSDPRLCLAHAWSLTLSGDVAEAEARLADAESIGGKTGRREGGKDDETSLAVSIQGEIAAVRGRIAALAGDLAATARYAREALGALPEDDPLRGDVALNLGFAALGEGDMAGAERAYAESERASRRAGNERTALLAVRYRAALELARGHLRRATQILREALDELADREVLPPAAGLLYVGLGEILYEQNDLAAAEEHLRLGLALGQRGGDVKILLPGHIALAHLEQTWGQTGRAEETMAIAARMMPSPFLAAAQARLALGCGTRAEAERWAREEGADHDTPASQAREFELATLARLDIARGDFAAADDLADRLYERAELDGRTGGMAEALVLRALVAGARGGPEDAARASDALARSLEMVAAEGAQRAYLDEGPPMLALLAALRAEARRGSRRLTPEAGAHLDKILAGVPESTETQTAPGPVPSADANAALPEPLTPRELEILRLIDEGMSNREIAERLFVSVGTIKTHTHRAYAKLDVTGRTQALARARAFGLLEG